MPLAAELWNAPRHSLRSCPPRAFLGSIAAETHPFAGSTDLLKPTVTRRVIAKPNPVTQFRIFVWIAFAASWGIGGAGVLIARFFPAARDLDTASPLYYLAAYSISGTGILLTALFLRGEGLRQLLRRLVPRVADSWAYGVVIVGYVVITNIAVAAAHGIHSLTQLSWGAVALQLPMVLLRDPGPVGEEFGWRGFALPRLLDHVSPLHASIRLGLVHTLWHVPLFVIPGMPQAQLSFPAFAVGVIAIAVFDTFLYLRATGNLLLAILVHLLANACGDVARANDALTEFFLLEGIVALSLVVFGALKGSRVPTTVSVAPTG